MIANGWTLSAAAALTAIWLTLVPRGTRGANWHYIHALLPPLAIALILLLPLGILRDTLTHWLAGGLAALAVIAAAWLLGTLLRNHGMMDVAYPIAPMAIAWTVAARMAPDVSATGWTALGLVSLWGVRLSIQTLRDNHGSEREPYATWRARGGRRWLWWSAFQVHLLQFVTIWIWSLPLAFAVTAPGNSLAIVAGVAIWLAGFALQASADMQLARFRRDPARRGRILDSGAWGFVRQPNYLGEALMWWGYFGCALAHPWGALAIAGPLYVTWFMGFGSAGPFKERHMARTRGAAWDAYCARVPRFFPWPRPQVQES
ncbi:DUF1295 domain-containing protein [Allosphingosinicella indica]|uniref:Steroid 5-alpha reductase family enzyme n=1 Tax=Allosphingosinicella indica TaxID=941907 RepID=A0A1X7G0A8_9SPHN|nr:DUF1295 domain-containing protein [Allosphingosinicella indica]SMF61696.1 Steroid 5-alpha reductase family enzyme [Allosphingosinicella indica]